MTEYFAVLVSNPAPFFGDTWDKYISAATPGEAAEMALRAAEKHPAGAYSVRIYVNADSFHKTPETPLVRLDGAKPFRSKP